ncbi:MAG: N-acetylmuramoyl-L-alanine amidase [Clostridia bacterium]|nr:N-acetylmuramoyl-L-alanine amidase [Clostridia bacterium]
MTKKKHIKRWLTLIAFILIMASLLFVFNVFGGLQGYRQRQRAKQIQMPDYVNVQLLNVGMARTGIPISDVKNIVIHYVGNPNSSAQNNREFFNNPTTKVSSHFIVGLEGEIIQCVPLSEKSSASNWRNKDTISIEVCHPDESGKFNDITMKSLVQLTAFLCKSFHLNEQDIIRHYDITGKECPRYFVTHEEAFDEFKNKVKLEMSK